MTVSSFLDAVLFLKNNPAVFQHHRQHSLCEEYYIFLVVSKIVVCFKKCFCIRIIFLTGHNIPRDIESHVPNSFTLYFKQGFSNSNVKSAFGSGMTKPCTLPACHCNNRIFTIFTDFSSYCLVAIFVHA